MKWIAGAALALVATLTFSSIVAANGNGAGGVTGPAIYFNGELYRTVGTPTHHFADTGAPEHSFDTIYAIDGQPNVADGAPGAPGFNGGRWQVRPVTFDDYDAAVTAYDTNGSMDLDSVAEVEAALEGGVGGAVLGDVTDSFECPMIPVPHSH